MELALAGAGLEVALDRPGARCAGGALEGEPLGEAPERSAHRGGIARVRKVTMTPEERERGILELCADLVGRRDMSEHSLVDGLEELLPPQDRALRIRDLRKEAGADLSLFVEARHEPKNCVKGHRRSRRIV